MNRKVHLTLGGALLAIASIYLWPESPAQYSAEDSAAIRPSPQGALAQSTSANATHRIPRSHAHNDLSATINLWNSDPQADTTGDDVPMEHLRFDVGQINSLILHSAVAITVPQAGRIYTGKVIEVYQPYSGVDELSVALDNMDELFVMSLSRGDKASYGWINTPQGHFNIELNHQTGKGTITSNRELLARYPLENDFIPIDEVDGITLPPGHP